MLLRVIPIRKRHLNLRPSYMRAIAVFRCETPCSLMPIDQITLRHMQNPAIILITGVRT